MKYVKAVIVSIGRLFHDAREMLFPSKPSDNEMLEGLTTEILPAAISEFQFQTAADRDESVAHILRLMTDSGSVDLMQTMTEAVVENPMQTRRLLIRAFFLQHFIFGFNAALTIEEAKTLQLLVKND